MATRAIDIPRARFHFTQGSFWQHLVLIVVACLVLVPLAFLILGSFSTARLPTEFTWAQMGLKNYEKVWLDPGTYKLFYNTAVYVGGATIIGVTLAALLAWAVERTNMPGKIWLYAGIPMTLAVPGLLQAMAWVLLLSPKSGFINRWLMDWWGMTTAPINIYTLGGMVIPGLIILFPRTRTFKGVLIAAGMVLVGMWVERFLIVVAGLRVPLMPYEPRWYVPTWVEWSVLAGAFAMFGLVIAVIAKLVPVISVWEVAEQYGEGETEAVEAAAPGGEPVDQPGSHHGFQRVARGDA